MTGRIIIDFCRTEHHGQKSHYWGRKCSISWASAPVDIALGAAIFSRRVMAVLYQNVPFGFYINNPLVKK